MSGVELVVVALAVAIGAVTKGIAGLGLPVVAVPVMAGFLGVEEAVVVMAFPSLASNLWLVREHRAARHQTRHLPALVVPGLVGAALGSWLLTSVDETLLAVVVAVLVGVYAVSFVANPEVQLPEPVARRLSPAVGLGAGVMQGTAGFSGPLVGAWLHSFRLPRPAYVLSVTTVFGLVGVAQVVTLAALGRYTVARVIASALALAVVAVGVPVGSRLAHRVSPRAFDRVVVGLLVASAAWLLASRL
ncbi:MAG TPA: sulfite exporter TauE/SafE family protein [Acidimicrobiales bacterium]|nr:sulfite exporter TauE/SafE family protein [Acidimicrobiales bacterium]